MNDYSVFVDTRAPAGAVTLDPDDDRIDELMDLLQPHAGGVSGPADGWGAVVSVDARDPDAAYEHAVRVILDAAARAGMPDWPVVNVRVVRGDVLEEENERPTMPDLVSGPEAAEMLGVTRQRLHQLATRHPDFPTPAYRLGVGMLWHRPAVQRFADEWERRPGRPPAKDAHELARAS